MRKILLFILIFLSINNVSATITVNSGTMNYYTFDCKQWQPYSGEWVGYTTLEFIPRYGNGLTYINAYEGGGGCGLGNYVASIYKNDSGVYINDSYGSFKITGKIYIRGYVGMAHSGISDEVKYTTTAFYDEDFYTLFGTVCGIETASLYYYNSDWILLEEKDIFNKTYYSFNIMNTTTYKICLDGSCYEFTCNSSNVEFNKDLCDYQILYYVDDCANLLKNPHVYIIKNDDWENYLLTNGTSNTDVFLIPDEIKLNDKLDIYIDTDQGTQHRTIYAEIGEDTLYHSFKSWNLGVTVYDINTSEYVSGAKVSVKQVCRINGYPCNTYGLTNSYGFVKTFDLSNQDYQVKVEKEGYNTFGWQTIHANFDAQHTEYVLRVNLQNSTKGDGNGTVGDPDNPNDGDGTGGDSDDELPQTPCSIMWTNDNNHSISEINDSQNARLHYKAGNCTNILYFEYYDTDTGMWEKIGDSTLLTAKESGFKQYTPVNWTKDETTVYRGRLWAYSCGCDAIDQIKVWNTSDENITVFDNLTANVFFRHKIGGQYINPNAPISIISYATSNNVSLMNIELKLFNESTEVDSINYDVFTWWDGDSFNPALWEPNYEYATGFNYTVRMYGLNNALLDVDTVYANATGDNPFDTGNTLCIEVFDQNSMPLANTYVYIEGWDTKPTENDNEVCFSGLPDDTYKYRATKPSYQDRGFLSVDLTSDDTVNYILDKISEVHSVSDARLNNLQIKTLYLPLMYLLLIMILFGGLKYVSK